MADFISRRQGVRVPTERRSRMPVNRLCGYALLICFSSPVFPMLLFGREPAPVSYDLKVTIEPSQGNIEVRGRIELPLESPRAGDLQFGLHETFAIKQLSVNSQIVNFSYSPREFTPINPATRNVVVQLPSGISEDKIHLDIQYGGHLKKIPEFGTYSDQKQALDDQINSRLVELANYSSWYPQFFAYGHPIAIHLEVSLPQGWIAICSGKRINDYPKGGRTITRWSSPKDTDILIAAAPTYKEKSIRVSGAEVEVYYTRMPEEFLENEMRQIVDVMKLFTKYLGETTIPGGTIKHVFSPKRRGQGRAGIARPGMIVTSEGLTLGELAKDPKFSLFQDIAHEIGHFWWNFGSGQGDWINEAFAEYFSAIAVQKILSEKQFDAVLEQYRKEVRELPANAPPLSTVPFDGSNFVIRYYKGSLMLDRLRHVMGDEQFFRASRDFFQRYKGQSIGTAEFRSFWNGRLEDHNKPLDVWLDSTGASPLTADDIGYVHEGCGGAFQAEFLMVCSRSAFPLSVAGLALLPMDTPSQLVGQTVSRYCIIEKIGGGGIVRVADHASGGRIPLQLPRAAMHKVTHAS